MRKASVLRAVTIGFAFTLLMGCRTTSVDRGPSHLREYEAEEYDNEDICQLMQAEALTVFANMDSLNVYQVYRNIHDRERSIFAGLVTRIEECQIEGEQGGVSEGPRNSIGVSNDCEQVPTGRLDFYKRRLTELDRCKEINDTSIPATLTRTAQRAACREINGQLPDWFTEDCEVNQQGIRDLGADALESVCDNVAAVIKDRTPEELTQSVVMQCSSQVLGDVCGRLGAATANIAAAQVATDEAILRAAQQDLEEARNFGVENIKEFAKATAMCVGAYSVQKLKEYVVDQGTQYLSRSVFKEYIKDYQKMLKDAEEYKKANFLKFMALAACKHGTYMVADRIEQTPRSVPNDACSPEALSVDRFQMSQCMRTVGDGCEIASGRIDLSELTGLNDRDLREQAILSIAEGGLEAACLAGGKVSSIACSTISKSATYIKDAMAGRSNPWADCLGTPKIGACVGQKWFEWTNGIRASDLSVGVDQERVVAETRTRHKKLCWCWMKCYKDHRWPRSNEFYHKEFKFFPGHAGSAGDRLCNANERTHQNKGERDGVSIFYKYTDCGVYDARQSGNGPFLPPGETIEIRVDSQWKTYRIPREGYACTR